MYMLGDYAFCLLLLLLRTAYTHPTTHPPTHPPPPTPTPTTTHPPTHPQAQARGDAERGRLCYLNALSSSPVLADMSDNPPPPKVLG